VIELSAEETAPACRDVEVTSIRGGTERARRPTPDGALFVRQLIPRSSTRRRSTTGTT
jgi:hypothetical protein